MPLVKNFTATNLPRAFILNGLAAAVTIVLALYIKGRMDTYQDPKGEQITRTTDFNSIGLTFLITFIASVLGYILLYFTFGYGGGMLATN